MKKLILTISILTIIFLGVITIIFNNKSKYIKKNVDYDYVYLISNLPSYISKKSTMVFVENRKIVNEFEFGKWTYNNLFIDSNNYINTIGDYEEFGYTYDSKINQLNTFNLSNTNDNKKCTGSFVNMLNTNNGNGYILNYGYINNDTYMFYVKINNDCYNIPLIMETYSYDSKKNIINIEGYQKSVSNGVNVKQSKYLYYQIDLNNKKVSKINLKNQDEYTPSISGQYIESYISHGNIYSVFEYYDNQYKDDSVSPNRTIYLVKRDPNTLKILNKVELDKKTSDVFSSKSRNDNIIGYFENDKLYFVKYDNGRNFINIYNLEGNLENSIDITRDDLKEFKLSGKYTIFKNGKLHYINTLYKKGIAHYVYNIDKLKYENDNIINYEFKENQQIFSFDIR